MFASKIKDLDWIDIAIHEGLAIAGIAVLHLFGVPLWLLCGFNTVFWPVREFWQKVSPNQGHLRLGEATHAIFTRPQPLLEWVAPVLTGVALYWGLG